MSPLPTIAKVEAIVDALQQQHGKIERMLIAFERQLAIFEAGRSPDYEFIAQIIAFCIGYLSLHRLAAEKPLLMALMEQHVIHGFEAEAFEKEYEQVVTGARKTGDAVEAIIRDAEVPRRILSQIARDFIDSCRQHMKTEERLLLPAAIKSLRPDDWDAISKSMSSITDVSADLLYLSQRAQYQTIVRWDESG